MKKVLRCRFLTNHRRHNKNQKYSSNTQLVIISLRKLFWMSEKCPRKFQKRKWMAVKSFYTGISIQAGMSILDLQSLKKDLLFSSVQIRVFRIWWREGKYCFRSKIHYTFKLQAYGQLFYFDKIILQFGLLWFSKFHHETWLVLIAWC